MGKFRSTVAAGTVNVFGHTVSGNVHLTQPPEDLLGAGVVVLGDEALQLGNQILGFPGCGVSVAEGTKLREDIHQRVAGVLHLRRGLACGFLLKFLVGFRLAPFAFAYSAYWSISVVEKL